MNQVGYSVMLKKYATDSAIQNFKKSEEKNNSSFSEHHFKNKFCWYNTYKLKGLKHNIIQVGVIKKDFFR